MKNLYEDCAQFLLLCKDGNLKAAQTKCNYLHLNAQSQFPILIYIQQPSGKQIESVILIIELLFSILIMVFSPTYCAIFSARTLQYLKKKIKIFFALP